LTSQSVGPAGLTAAQNCNRLQFSSGYGAKPHVAKRNGIQLSWLGRGASRVGWAHAPRSVPCVPWKTGFICAVLLAIERTLRHRSEAIGPRLRGCVCLRCATPSLTSPAFENPIFQFFLEGGGRYLEPHRFARGLTGQSFP